MSRRYSIPATKKYCEVHFDWATVTFSLKDVSKYFGYSLEEARSEAVWVDIADELHLDTLVFRERKTGIYNYDRSLSLASGSIIVGFNSKIKSDDKQDFYFGDQNSLMIQASGEGLKTLKAVFDVLPDFGLTEYFKTVRALGGRATRLDIACDLYNFSHLFSPLFSYRKMRKHEVKTSFRYWKWMASGSVLDAYDLDDPTRYGSSKEGTTLYWGRNPKQLRQYNKKAQMMQSKQLDFDCKSWYRWEFQFNEPFADQVLDLYLNKIAAQDKTALQDIFLGVLSDNLNFVVRSKTDKNRGRWQIAGWFENFLQGSNKIHLRNEHEKPTLERKQRFLNKSMSNSIKTVLEANAQVYLANGLESSYEDAFKRALNDFVRNMLETGNIDSSAVSSYVAENNFNLRMQDLKSLTKSINGLHFAGKNQEGEKV